jgi:hypothetical protein
MYYVRGVDTSYRTEPLFGVFSFPFFWTLHCLSFEKCFWWHWYLHAFHSPLNPFASRPFLFLFYFWLAVLLVWYYDRFITAVPMGYEKREDTNVIRSIFRRTDNAMSRRKGTKRHQIVDKTLHQTNVWGKRTTLNEQGASEG